MVQIGILGPLEVRDTAVDPERLVENTPAGYRLTLEPDAVDAYRFEELAAAGHRAVESGDTARGVLSLTGALELWRGTPLVDAGEADYAGPLLARWEGVHTSARADLAMSRRALGETEAAVAGFEQLVTEFPLRERFVEQLMTTLAAAGRVPEALTVYDAFRERLADKLGTDPGHGLAELHLTLLRGETPVLEGDLAAIALGTHAAADADTTGYQPRRTAGDRGMTPYEPEPNASTAPRGNLRSATSSFIGRAAETQQIGASIDGARLTTVVGPGGAGKTRLAIESSRPLSADFADGAWMIELASISDGGEIAQTVLTTLGVQAASILEPRRETAPDAPAIDRLTDGLAGSHMLLVLDNCEHIIDDAAVFANTVLARCPGVRVLATSREPLGLPGEAIVSAPPLGLPPPDAAPAGAASYPAVRLLVERGRAAHAGFEVTGETVGPIVNIVRRLDGQPLAIELAAARLRVLPVAEIAARLEDRFRLLSGGLRPLPERHRTLRAVVAWSWDLLTEPERLLAERLAVFPAGATAESATAVCVDILAPADDVDDLMLSLVDKSLLTVVSNAGMTRYRMLETIREYGADRLAERDELATATRRHADYFAAEAERLDPLLRTASQLDALAQFHAEQYNMIAAIRHLGESGDEAGVLRMVFSLCWYWMITGNHTEVGTWTRFALAVADDAAVSTHTPDYIRVRTATLLVRSAAPEHSPGTHWEQGERDLSEVRERIRTIDDGADQVTTLLRLYVEFFTSRGANMRHIMARLDEIADPWLHTVVRSMNVLAMENTGDVAGARDEIDEVCDAFTRLGDQWGLSTMFTTRAGLRGMDGDVDGGIDDYRRALECIEKIGATNDDMLVRLRMAGLYLRRGRADAAREQLNLIRSRQRGVAVAQEHVLLADSVEITILLAEQRDDEAAALAEQLRGRMPAADPDNPLHGHLHGLVWSMCALAATRTGDLDVVGSDLATAYPAAVGTWDRPLIAAVGIPVAAYAAACGDAIVGAETLGAAAALRGSDDAGDVAVTMAREAVLGAIGGAGPDVTGRARAEFDAAYARGEALDTDAAIARLDPARLDPARITPPR